MRINHVLADDSPRKLDRLRYAFRKHWIGIHVSHSFGFVLFGLIYGYLALSRWEVLLRSHFLIGLGLLWLVGFILLAHIYWFRIALIGVSLATLFYLAGVVDIFVRA